jgi:hypothetical protein
MFPIEIYQIIFSYLLDKLLFKPNNINDINSLINIYYDKYKFLIILDNILLKKLCNFYYRQLNFRNIIYINNLFDYSIFNKNRLTKTYNNLLHYKRKRNINFDLFTQDYTKYLKKIIESNCHFTYYSNFYLLKYHSIKMKILDEMWINEFKKILNKYFI